MAKAGDTRPDRTTNPMDGSATRSNVIDARERFLRRRGGRSGTSANHSRGTPGRDSFVAPPRRPYQSVPLDEEYPDDEEFFEIGFEEPDADKPFCDVPGEDYGVGRKWT